jgi:CubicO group peptidase (beta-lactamase class C family)
MHLVETGRIDLDKPLVSYLSQPLYEYTFENKRRGYSDLKNDERYKKITARMCLDHSTGFPNWRWFEDDEKLKIKFFPGTDYSYSGEGIYLLQFVIEQRLKERFEDGVRRDVLGPLGLSRSSFIWQPEFAQNVCFGHDENGKASALTEWKESSAAGSLFTTITDFSHFFESMMQRRGLKKKSFEEMLKPQFRVFSKKQFGPMSQVHTNDYDGIQLSYGLGWGLLKSRYGWAFFKEGHDDGFQHYSIGIPEKGIAMIVMTNSDNGENIFRELLDLSIRDDFTPWFWEGYR